MILQKTLGLNHHNLDEAAVRQIASKYRLTGGAIVNVLRYAAVHAIKRDMDRIAEVDLIKGISRELVKEGRTP